MGIKQCFSGVIIGEATLAIQCADILLDHGHALLAIVAANPEIVGWADSHQVPCLDPEVSLSASLNARPFDYVFSIANPRVLSKEVIGLPRRAAINFHDGPLPRYAGLHATSWALINREQAYAVTWHVMSEQVDAGKILKQRQVEMAEDETALSLNLKCYEAGIRSFAELVDELASGTSRPQQQDLRQRSYYPQFKRPPNAGLLSWSRPAAELSALVRALDFGQYPNPLGRPKLLLGNECFVCPSMEVLPRRASAAPGTIVEAKNGYIVVATADQEVRIPQLLALEGESVALAELTTRVGLRQGARLPEAASRLGDRITELNAAVCKHEAFWVRRLAALRPAALPYLQHAAGNDQAPEYAELEIEIPAEVLPALRKHGEWVPGEFCLAAFAAYLARLSGDSYFHLGLRTPSLTKDISGLESLFSPWVPLPVDVDFARSLGELYATLHAELESVQRHKTFVRDVFARFPGLRGGPHQRQVATAEDIETGRAPLHPHRDSQGRRGNLPSHGHRHNGQHGRGVCLPVEVELVADLSQPTRPGAADLCLVVQEDGARARLVYNKAALAERDAQNISSQFQTFLQAVMEQPASGVAELPLLTPAARAELLEKWNATAAEFPREKCLHHLVEDQAARTPDRVAVVCDGQQLSYRELNARANQLARYLKRLGVGLDMIVGISLERSVEMVVGLLGILKAGGAYLPLDPSYPKERLAFMIEDAKAPVLVTRHRLGSFFPPPQAQVVRMDVDWSTIARESTENCDSGVAPHHLAYVIYTSGSTGQPKGVMVEHRNVVNFFTGMDRCVPNAPSPLFALPSTSPVWLAVTSLSFDISVLEIFWTLARGFKVVIYHGVESKHIPAPTPAPRSTRPMDFSLFYFSAGQAEDASNKYHLLIEGAKFADEHGFAAVWTPERHFHEFGGLYPNPSVTSAALAMVTTRIQLRSGSVVAPLHSPVRIAEEWAIVDNLSHGRVAISFASGWMPEDFVLKPENFADRKDEMFRTIAMVRKLWRGEAVPLPGPLGGEVAVKAFPRPIQADLPVWVTAAGNPETFEMAGAAGANVLTHLLGQTIEEVAEKISLYRQARAEAGHPGRGHVSLMLHTFVSDTPAFVRDTVRQPLTDYLRASASLIRKYAWAFPTFKRAGHGMEETEFSSLPPEDLEAVLAHAFDRYFETSGLFGTPESCVERIEQLKANDVDEVACLIDFGVPAELALDGLKHLDALRVMANPAACAEGSEDPIPSLIRQHGVTHLQCTPSMASVLLRDDETKRALGSLKALLIGGEAFPATLATQLRRVVAGKILNMYGPTETTVWSTTCEVGQVYKVVPIGRPIANTQIYILDRNLQPTPIGVPGELFIGGTGVARGYLGRPELTAERFVDNPFSQDSTARLYRTGDVARYLPDGNLEFMGRLDHQVKIRGHRIELGEIEARLDAHPAVRQAIVAVREDLPGERRLVAYVIAREGQTLHAPELRDFVKDNLPDYMVPAHVVRLEAFPQTPNGKIDRKALPPPGKGRLESGACFEPPSTAIEEALAGLWTETLGVKRFSRNDNFFEQGGDSLTAFHIVLSIRQACCVDLPLETLFRSPTLADLAGRLEEAFLAQIESGNIPRVPVKEAARTRLDREAKAPAQRESPGVKAEFEPPCTPVEEQLARIWARTLGVQRVGRHDNFFELGGNSLLGVTLLLDIETEFGKRLPLATLFEARTLEQLALKVQQHGDAASAWSSLVPIQTQGSKRPFFCVHAAGGNVLFYRDVARYMGSDYPFYGLQCRGLDGETDYLSRIEDMASHYLREVRAVQPEGPYHLGGFCMGGTVAYEMAQQLEKEGQKTAFLGLLDTYNYSEMKAPESLVEKLSYAKQKFQFHWWNLRRLGPRGQVAYFTEKVRVAGARELARLSIRWSSFSKRFDWVNPARTPEVFLEDFNEKVASAYRPAAYRGQVTIFRPRRNYGFYDDPQMGWGKLVLGGLNIIELPVNPGGMFAEPYVQIVAANLRQCLDEAQQQLTDARIWPSPRC